MWLFHQLRLGHAGQSRISVILRGVANQLITLDEIFKLLGHKYITRLIPMSIIWNKHFCRIKTWHGFHIQNQKLLVFHCGHEVAIGFF